MNIMDAIRQEAERVWGNLVPLRDGKCKSASIALGIHLATMGIGCDLVMGTFRGHRHYWLSYKKLIIDPTHGQYKDCPDIFIGKHHEDYKVEAVFSYDFENIAIALGMDVYTFDEYPR